MGLLAVAAHAFDAWCIHRVGVTAASSGLLLLASLASGTITQVGSLVVACLCQPCSHGWLHPTKEEVLACSLPGSSRSMIHVWPAGPNAAAEASAAETDAAGD